MYHGVVAVVGCGGGLVCQQVAAGLEGAQPGEWHLERVAPPAADFPVAPGQCAEVKNLVWRRAA